MKRISILYSILVITIFPFCTKAQGIYNNGANIVISTGTYFVIEGNNGNLRNETNNKNGVLDLAGTLKIGGNLSNNVIASDMFGTVASGSEVVFTGTNTQTIRGTTSAVFQFDKWQINNGAIVELAAGKKVTCTTTMVNNGTLTLKSTGNDGTATLLTPAVISIKGTTNVEQYLTTGRTWYVSSPVTGAMAGAINAVTGTSMVSYNETTGSTSPWITASSTLTPAKGYVVAPPTNTNPTVVFAGALNTGAQSIALTRTVGQTKEGFNLVGNPYPSYLNAMTAINTNASVEKTVWYRTKGTNAYFFETVNTSSGAGTNLSGTGAVTGYIPPMQSFWVRATAGTTLNFANTDRSHATGSTTLLKAPVAQNAVTQMLRLQVSNSLNKDETLIYFNANASDELDNYDSKKMTNGDVAIPEIYTTVGSEKLTINGMKNIPTNELPLGLTPGQANTFTIKATEFSNFDANTHVILKDRILGIEQDLNVVDAYTFASVDASVADRFNVIFKTTGFSTETIYVNDNSTVMVYRNAANQIAVQLQGTVSNDAIIKVYNLLGQQLETTRLKNTTTIVGKSLTSGAYVVTVKNGGKTVTRKVSLR